jgi:hypothetical protein
MLFADRSLCGGRAGAGVFSDILNVWESYTLDSHSTVFGVFGILHLGGQCQQSNINLLS